MSHRRSLLREQELHKNFILFDKKVRSRGYTHLAGVDEAGRGPLAGPVVAAACLFQKVPSYSGINDSKQITPSRRQELFQRLTKDPYVIWGIGLIEPSVIDEINIAQATYRAMDQAIASLGQKPDLVLIDGFAYKFEGILSEKVIRGDAQSLSIAAASIIAKETRDAIMVAYDAKWPEYGFAQHKGYATKKHRAALDEYGPCPIHRRSFLHQRVEEQLTLKVS